MISHATAAGFRRLRVVSAAMMCDLLPFYLRLNPHSVKWVVRYVSKANAMKLHVI